jgi:radical SAM protein (TIGR01212 family)
MIKYSEFLKEKYGEKVYKIPINTGGTCPNRDGTKGVGGCIFCSISSHSSELMPEHTAILEQIKTNISFIKKKYKANKYIIYFQNFTGTYLPLDKFSQYLNIIKTVPNVVGIAVSTRPDCLDSGHLELLHNIMKQNNIDIFIELGLQSANEETLIRLNRCHSLEDFINGAKKVKAFGFYLDVHIILNLPWDDLNDVYKMSDVINQSQADSIKIHSLHIPYNTKLFDMYQNNEFTIITKDEYFKRLHIMLCNINKKIAVQRLFSRAQKNEVAFCNWGMSWWKLEDEFRIYERECSDNGFFK